MDRTNIEWTDATWNPLRGCSRVSEGCRNCYAERVAARFSGHGMPYEGLAQFVRGVPVDKLEMHENIRFESEARWTGKVAFVEERLQDPLRWKAPRRIFVNSMSDLFHEGVTDSQIDAIFRVMIEAKHHTFQILTKRPERMFKYMDDRWVDGHANPTFRPPKNIWLGVSAENQETFKKRVPLLLKTPAAVRWVSVEPMLEAVELHDGFWRTTRDHTDEYESVPLPTRLDWVVIGGESGPGARPFFLDAALEMLDECEQAGVPMFMKQFGARPYTWNANRWDFEDHVRFIEPRQDLEDSVPGGVAACEVVLRDRKGGDMEEWPSEFRVRQFPRQAVAA
jgi:protein gp37